MRNKRALIIFSVIAILLLIPLIAMQFTHEVDWSIADFVIMGILLSVSGISCEFFLRKVKNIKIRIVLCGAILLIFFLICAELAVNVFGSPFAGS